MNKIPFYREIDELYELLPQGFVELKEWMVSKDSEQTPEQIYE